MYERMGKWAKRRGNQTKGWEIGAGERKIGKRMENRCREEGEMEELMGIMRRRERNGRKDGW